MSIAVLVNAHARRGSAKVAELAQRILPSARIVHTQSLDDARRFVREELASDPPRLVLSGGGDGTAVTLVNDLRAAGVSAPTIGLLPLGTGNGWANVMGAPPAEHAFRALAAFGDSPLPVTEFPLVETEGRMTPFAGAGWDADLVADYEAQVRSTPKHLRRATGGFGGYLRSIFTRTVPRHAFGKSNPVVTLRNLGARAIVIDPQGEPQSMENGEAGAVLYEGRYGTAGAATMREVGLGFRAFPHAGKVPGRMAVRVYNAHPVVAAANIRRLWKGAHPLAGSHDFQLDHCRMEFDRPVMFEIGGEVVGERTAVEFRLCETPLRMLDWRKLRGRA
jgi:diacylglycerol kinase family enzyme